MQQRVTLRQTSAAEFLSSSLLQGSCRPWSVLDKTAVHEGYLDLFKKEERECLMPLFSWSGNGIMDKAALGGSGDAMEDLGKQLRFLALTRGSRRVGGTAKAISLHKRE